LHGKSGLFSADKTGTITKGKPEVKKAIKDADYIFPLAALVGAPICNRDNTAAVTVNRGAVALIVKLASKQQRIIIPTTNSGYGIGQKGVFCTEETALNPITSYGTTKMEAEKIVLDPKAGGLELLRTKAAQILNSGVFLNPFYSLEALIDTTEETLWSRVSGGRPSGAVLSEGCAR